MDINNFSDSVSELSYLEMLNTEGGVDKNSFAYRLGYSIGYVCGQVEGVILKIADKIAFG
jgi:hypothetical protein